MFNLNILESVVVDKSGKQRQLMVLGLMLSRCQNEFLVKQSEFEMYFKLDDSLYYIIY